MQALKGGWIRGASVIRLLAVGAAVPLPVQPAELPGSSPAEDLPDRLVFTGSANYPPFQSLDSNGEPTGFVIDIEDAIADQGKIGAVHRLIVRSTITLAHELGLTVVAEGVEDEETLQALVAIDCDTVQGYFVSRPLGEEILLSFREREIAVLLSEATGSDA